MSYEGSRLPDPWYERVLDRLHAQMWVRTCKYCKYQYTTAEVALFKGWDGESAACCPRHPDVVGKIKHGISPAQAETGRYGSKALSLIYSMGGKYRRRRCEKCDERWTTAELDASGVYRQDVTRCPRCQSNTKGKRSTAHDTRNA